MKGEWCYYNSYFDAEVCDYILTQGLKLPQQDAKMGIGNEFENTEFRRSKIRFIMNTDKNFKFLFDEIWKMAIQANDEWFGFNITKMSYIQLAEYDESYQGEYKEHHDVFWVNNDPKYHRKLSAVIQLTDPKKYEGGYLELVEASEKPNEKDIRNQGSTIFFPSFLRHQATSVTKGTRYSLACWFDGPKWQ